VIGDNNVLGSDDGLNADSSGNRGLHAIGGADSVLGDAICHAWRRRSGYKQLGAGVRLQSDICTRDWRNPSAEITCGANHEEEGLSLQSDR
jgi:hypothetical protein